MNKNEKKLTRLLGWISAGLTCVFAVGTYLTDFDDTLVINTIVSNVGSLYLLTRN